MSVWLICCRSKLPYKFVSRNNGFILPIFCRDWKGLASWVMSLICGMSARGMGAGGSISKIVGFFAHRPGSPWPLDPLPPPHAGWISEPLLVA